MPRNSKPSFFHLSFARLGEYRMQVCSICDSERQTAKPFHCAIRDREELLTECIEIHKGEILHGHDEQNVTWPLVKFDEHAFWVWMPKQSLWWPLRDGNVQLDLDRWNRVRIKWLDVPHHLK